MSDLPLFDNFFATAERALFHRPSNTAIISDLHLGAEAELSRRGIFMPDVSAAALGRAWEQVAARLGGAPLPKLVIAGDLFDSPVPDRAAIVQAGKLFESLPPSCDITVLPGNHDPEAGVLASILPAKIKIAASMVVGDYSVAHGDRPLSDDAMKTGDRRGGKGGLIVGHQHPAVTLANRIQSAKMACFAVCEVWERARNLIVLPAFSRAPLGSNLSRRHWLLHLPWPGEERIRICGIIDSPTAGQVLDFGKLCDLRLPF